MTRNSEDDLLEHAPCGFFSFNDDGIILTVNHTLCEMMDFNVGELEGKKVEQILTLAGRIFYQTHFFPIIKLRGSAEEIFLSLQAKNKTEIPVLINAKRMMRNNSFANDCILIPVHQRRKYEDEIVHAKEAAEKALKENQELIMAKQALELQMQESDKQITKLEQNNRELIQLNWVISHDLQEPARKISLFSDILDRDKHLFTPNGLKALQRIEFSSNKILQLIDNLQSYVSTGMGHFNIEQVDLNRIFNKLTRKINGEKHVVKMSFCVEQLPVIDGNQHQLEILFTNLLNNAVKFHHPEKELVVQVDSSLIQHNSFKVIKGKYKYVDFVKIDITDNGIGFDNQYKEYIFQILKKAHDTYSGLGFGLALCKKVVDNHYGAIAAESSPGFGSKFTILLPLKQ